MELPIYTNGGMMKASAYAITFEEACSILGMPVKQTEELRTYTEGKWGDCVTLVDVMRKDAGRHDYANGFIYLDFDTRLYRVYRR